MRTEGTGIDLEEGSTALAEAPARPPTVVVALEDTATGAAPSLQIKSSVGTEKVQSTVSCLLATSMYGFASTAARMFALERYEYFQQVSGQILGVLFICAGQARGDGCSSSYRVRIFTVHASGMWQCDSCSTLRVHSARIAVIELCCTLFEQQCVRLVTSPPAPDTGCLCWDC